MDKDYLLLGYEVLEKGGGHRRKYGGSTALCYFLFRKMSIGKFKLSFYYNIFYHFFTIYVKESESAPLIFVSETNKPKENETLNFPIDIFLKRKWHSALTC